MISFSTLVQNKRKKMLIFVLLLTISLLIRESATINLTYILKRGATIQPSCIADEFERYTAIGWVHPLPDQQQHLPKILTKFLPDLSAHPFNCKFEKKAKCRTRWGSADWKISENGPKSNELLLDRRWEDLPILYTANGSREFEHRIEVSDGDHFQVPFSLMALENVEILLCEGWNPYDYPCYHLLITTNDIFLRKYPTLPKEVKDSDPNLDSYSAYAPILSEREWRNFIVGFTAKKEIFFIDVNNNRRVAIEYQDASPIKPLYFLTRSNKSAIWKIHQNSFMYTTTSQLSRLGPNLRLGSKNLCLTILVSICKDCLLTFQATINNVHKILHQVLPEDKSNTTWQLIKLKYENYPGDSATIYVETKFLGKENETGYWAIDDARVCHENEVKVTFLNLENDGVGVSDAFLDGVSCQVIEHPKWRPKRIVYKEIKDFPSVSSTAGQTTINLTWPEEDPEKRINYFITYEANDLCSFSPHNEKRIKSSGFLTTNDNEIILNQLIPYTTYNISFSSILHENDKHSYVTTLETDSVTFEELPSNLKIYQNMTTAFVQWDKVECMNIYGHLIYSLSINNTELKFSKDYHGLSENSVTLTNLLPFTDYTLVIKTARSLNSSLNSTIAKTLEFRTKPGTAAKLTDFDVYEVGEKSASIRYNLPRPSFGVPVALQVRRCTIIQYGKCRSNLSVITRCYLWPDEYCVEVGNLIPDQNYELKLSVRNDNTNKFGDEVQLKVLTGNRVPAPPTNITYQTVNCSQQNYCDLNVSWMHPYMPNGTITAFHLFLNNTNGDTMKEIYKIDRGYRARYYLVIKFVPYSTSYDLYIQSVNLYEKSGFTHVQVLTDDISDYINQTPQLSATNDYSAHFKLPPLDPRIQSYTVTILVQDYNKNVTISDELLKNRKIANNLCHKFGNSRIEEMAEVGNKTQTIEIGSKIDPLQPSTKYCATFIFTNIYRGNRVRDVVYQKDFVTNDLKIAEASSRKYNQLYGLLLLLLLIPIGWYVYRRFIRKRRKPKKNDESTENEYETLPFDECEFNYASNPNYGNYNNLQHK